MITRTAVIADDHQMIRQGVRHMLEDCEISVAAETGDGLEAIALIRAHKPTLVVLDIAMPNARGIDVLVEARRWSPDSFFVILSGMTTARLFQDLIEAGADGVFLKSGCMAELSSSIETVLSGKKVYSNEVKDLAKRAKEAANLTNRERQILNLICGGMANRQIAIRLGISPKTVDHHRTSLMRKLDVHSTAQLFTYAVKHGLLEPDQTTL